MELVKPDDLDAYLKVLRANNVGAAILTVPERVDNEVRTVTLQVTFNLELPEMGQPPVPGGWKSPAHLDNPQALDPAALNDYAGRSS